MFLATPLSLGEPVRPVALRPYLSDKYAAYRTESSLAHTFWQFKETEPERTALFYERIMKNPGDRGYQSSAAS
jgi:hypothetical protein